MSTFNLNGNVGIKTVISPSYTLDVNGDINFTNNLYHNGSIFLGPTGPQGLTGPQGVQGISSGKLYYLNYHITGSIGSPYSQLGSNAASTTTQYTSSLTLSNAGNTGVLGEFITDANEPGVSFIPPGIWNATCFLSATVSGGGSPLTDVQTFIEFFKYTSTGSFEFLQQSSIQPITTTSASPYQLSAQFLQTPLSVTDRIVMKIICKNTSSPSRSVSIVGYFQDNTYSNVITSFSTIQVGPTGPGFNTITNFGDGRILVSTGSSSNSAIAYSNFTYDGNTLSVPNFTGSNIYASTQYLGNSLGSVTTPSYSWNGDTNCGLYHPSTDNIGFVTNGTESMRVDSNGYLLVGYSSSNGSYNLQVNSQIYATNSTIATSDGKYKQNVVPLTGALSLIELLNPVSYEWKPHPLHKFNQGTTLGFIAQEAAEVLKDTQYVNNIIKSNQCVYKDENGNEIVEDFLGIAEGHLIPLLTSALQEQSSKIKKQQTTIQSLQIQIKSLQDQIDLILGGLKSANSFDELRATF